MSRRILLLVWVGFTLLTGCGKKVTSPAPTPTATLPPWIQTNGPSASTAYALIASGSVLVAGTSNGIQRSTDLGASWAVVDNEIAHAFLANAGNLYAATSSGVLRSSNSGASWVPFGVGIPANTAVHSFAVRGSQLFAGLAGAGAVVSTDGGAHWADASTGLPSASSVTAMLGTSGAEVLGATAASGLFTQGTSGLTWSPAGTGLPGTPILALFESAPNRLAGTDGQGVFVLHASGPWQASTGIASGTSVNGVGQSSAAIFAATSSGLYRSTNHGDLWSRLTTGLSAATGFASVAPLGTSIFAGAFGHGVMRSTDDGATWSSSGPADASVTAIVEAAGVLMAGTDQGVHLSNDNGEHWAVSVPESGPIEDFTVRGDKVFAASAGGGVRRSTDGGASWSPANNGLPASGSATVVASNGVAIVAGVYFDPTGIYRSLDDGDSWTPGSGLPADPNLRALVASGTNLVASGSAGIFVSTDNGATWTASAGMPAGGPVFALGTSGSKMFAETGGGVLYVSMDGGLTWGVIGPRFPQSIQRFAAHGSTIAALGFDGELYRSVNSGATWSQDASFTKVHAVTAGTQFFFIGTEGGVLRAAY